MDKIELINDMNFISACKKYGLDINNKTEIEIAEDWIIVPTINEYIKFVFDKNYNVFCIDQYGYIESSDYVRQIYDDYTTANILPEPFTELSIQSLMLLASRIKIVAARDYNCKLVYNGWQLEEDNNEYYIGLLSYIKFLSNQVEKYYQESYRMAVISGLEYPSIENYISNIITIIDDYINKQKHTDQVIVSNDILKVLVEKDNTSLGFMNNIIRFYSYNSEDIDFKGILSIPENKLSSEKIAISEFVKSQQPVKVKQKGQVN